jgi:hypothetical protein
MNQIEEGTKKRQKNEAKNAKHGQQDWNEPLGI